MKKIFSILFILTISLELSYGTGQEAELIIYESDTLQLLSLPLDAYLGEYEERIKKYPILKTPCSTALWRGYKGLWKLKDDELFLVDVYLCKSKERSIFTELFESESPIKARWFTGNLFIQHGEMIKYRHSGFQRYYEEETVLQVSNGEVLGKQLFRNGYRTDDNNFPSNPDSVQTEVYKRLNWKQFPELSEDYKVFVMVKMGKVDSLTIVLRKAPEVYVKEIQRILTEFPDLRKFYSRGEPLEEGYTFPVIFSNAQRERYAR